MTPTLLGRWQTRIFLMLVVGMLPTLAWMLVFGAFDQDAPPDALRKLPTLLAYVTAIGLACDVIYIGVQKLRWDRDWPLAFQFVGGVVEGIVVAMLFANDLLPGVHFAEGDQLRFALHYGTVFLVTFAFLFGPMRVLFPRWRFRGGRIV